MSSQSVKKLHSCCCTENQNSVSDIQYNSSLVCIILLTCPPLATPCTLDYQYGPLKKRKKKKTLIIITADYFIYTEASMGFYPHNCPTNW